MPPRARNKAASPEAEEVPFEEALEELESIVQALDGDVTGLDEMVTRYERGMGLLKTCQLQLDAAQLRIEQITRRADGAVETSEVSPAESSGSVQVRPAAAPDLPPPDSTDDEIRLF